MTRRQEITEVLRAEALSLRDLSEMFHVHIKEILEDISHIEKSVRPQEELIMTPAQCRKCGFIFKDRSKFKKPSKCPKCKGMRIREPEFQIQKA